MEASMSEPFRIVETDDGPIIVIPDYATMTMEELQDYAVLGRIEALEEIVRREPRSGMMLDPNAPVTIPES
jgi:hypothetical protein